MGLYDRNYIGKNPEYAYNEESKVRINEFIKQTYQLFAGSLIGGAVGAYLGMSFMPAGGFGFWGVVILEFALLFAVYAVKDKPGINLAVLFAFTFVSGLTISPLLNAYVGRGMGGIIGEAFLLTSIAFGGLSLFAMNTKKDYTTMGKMLFITLIIVVVAGLLNLFFHSPILQLAIAVVSSVLFSFFILYDTQNIIQGNYGSPIEGAIALYLDFFNLFISLLQILGIFGEEE
ncbi:MAG: BAX inhibitor (BI)-1/YccA family protein [Nautilia sp.]|nr:MAG: BAX inhibitor (BI)-1/YccA family protein [Nautilia sp.]